MLRKIALSILPGSLVRKVQEIKKARRKKLLEKKKTIRIIYNDDLVRDLKAIGVKEGDALMVHTSLSRIGYVDGGAITVIAALREAIGPSGTLMMPSFPGNTLSKFHLEEHPYFDILNTPSKMGIITEQFRTMPGVKRSFHPTDPACAMGPLAGYFTEAHFGQLTPYNRNSPFYRLCEKNGKSLMIGTTFITTVLHVIEDEIPNFKFPIYDAKIYDVEMTDAEGKKHTMKTKVHNPEFSKKRKCDDLVPILEKDGYLVKGKIGEADSMLVDTKGMLESMIRYYHEKGVTMYTPTGS